MTGEHGGAAFVLLYIAASFLLALPIMLSEMTIGRRSRANTFGAMQKLAPGMGWKYLGLLTVVSPIAILSYYSVVGGWSVEYLFKSLAFEFNNTPSTEIGGLFPTFISSTWQPILVHTLFLLMVAVIVVLGVKKGIEKFTKFTMPALFIMVVAIMVYGLSLPGASEGVKYLVRPDFSKIDMHTVAAAMGQAFFSLSLGVGTILTYSSYVRKDENLVVSGLGTAGFDLFFALLAAFAVMPAVFAAGIAPGEGPGLVFQTLPYIFNSMGGGIPALSALIAIVFFVTILVAALTSAISMLEVGVAYLVEEKGVSRLKATWLLFSIAWVVGALCSLSFGPLSAVKLLGCTVFDFLDKVCSNFLMPFGGLLFTLFAGWKLTRKEVWDELTNGGKLGRNVRAFPVLWFLIRYVAPIAVVVIFVTNLLL